MMVKDTYFSWKMERYQSKCKQKYITLVGDFLQWENISDLVYSLRYENEYYKYNMLM